MRRLINLAAGINCDIVGGREREGGREGGRGRGNRTENKKTRKEIHNHSTRARHLSQRERQRKIWNSFQVIGWGKIDATLGKFAMAGVRWGCRARYAQRRTEQFALSVWDENAAAAAAAAAAVSYSGDSEYSEGRNLGR